MNAPKIDNITETIGSTNARLIAIKIYYEFAVGQTCLIMPYRDDITGLYLGTEVWNNLISFDKLDNFDPNTGKRLLNKYADTSKVKYTGGVIAHKVFAISKKDNGDIIWRVQ